MAVNCREAFLSSDLLCGDCLQASVRVVQDPININCVLLTINNIDSTDPDCDDVSGSIGSFCLNLSEDLTAVVTSVDKPRTLQVGTSGCPGSCFNDDETDLVVRFTADNEKITPGTSGVFRICFNRAPVDADFIAVSLHFQDIEGCGGVDSLCVEEAFINCGTTTTTTTTTTSTTTTTTTTTQCPIANPQTCCVHVVEFLTQLVPPALEGSVEITKIDVDASIEAVCPEKVIVCGKVTKEITYTAVKHDGTLISGKVLIDERSFQCVIDREDADEGDTFIVVGKDILCEANSFVQNMGTRPDKNNPGKTVNVFWKLYEKDLIKVCIRKA